MAEPEWKQFEILVANIQKELSPGSVVIHNDKILGRKSRVTRQIDVSIRGKVAQFDFLVIIDCKDYAQPVDVKDIEDFLGLIDDVGAQQGAMVSAKDIPRRLESGHGRRDRALQTRRHRPP